MELGSEEKGIVARSAAAAFDGYRKKNGPECLRIAGPPPFLILLL